jgi:hypothetical protein
LFAPLLFLVGACSTQQVITPPQRSQNPSPMIERTRAHGRIPPAAYDGVHDSIVGLLPRTADVYLPAKYKDRDTIDLVLNFHSASYITHHAAESTGLAFVGVTINLGGGSSAFNAPFVDSTVFPRLVDAVQETLTHHNVNVTFGRVVLVGFSAGYGAVRRILSQPENRQRVFAALLLDGIHADYIPERTVLAEGGRVDSSDVGTFLSFAREAARPDARVRFMITHSEVFPGTFVSTTEATNWLLDQMGMTRTAVLAWGPLLSRSHPRFHFVLLALDHLSR